MEQSSTVSSIGIARLAGVGRAAVSNWRRRYLDFPPPVGGTATSPAFDLAAVEKWLSAQGKLLSASGPQQTWREIEAVSGGPDRGEALWLAGLSLFNRWIDAGAATGEEVPSPDQLIKPVRRLDTAAADLLYDGLPTTWSARQRAVLSVVAKLDVDPPETFEDFYQQYVSSRGSTSDYTTPSGVARLMLSLGAPAERVMDPACGSGTLLMQAIAAGRPSGTGDSSRQVQTFGQDIDETAARITQLRLLFAYRHAGGSGPPPVIRVGDSLRSDAFPGQRVDLVVSNPPFGLHDWSDDQLAFDPRWEFGGLPPRTEPELAWVQDALAHLEPGGLAVLLMPPGAAWRSAGRRIRAELLRRNALRAVIGLPPRLLPVTAIGLHLWLLRRPVEGEGASQVLMADTTPASGDGPPDLAAVTETAVGVWQAFERGELEERAGVCKSVPVIDLLDEDVDVSPARHLAVAERQDVDASALLAAGGELIESLRSAGSSLPSLVEESDSSLATARRVSLDELARSGAVVIHRGISRHANEDEDERASEPAVTGADIIRGAPPSGHASYDGAQVEPGDVLLPTIARSVVARVATDEQVGAQLGHSVNAIRVDPQILDPWFVAGMLSASANLREAVRNSSIIRDSVRVNVKRLQVPLLPLADQRRYGEAFRRLAEFDIMLARAANGGHELARSLSDALSSGILAPLASE